MPFTVPYPFRSAGQRTPLNRLDADFAAVATWYNTRRPVVGPLALRPPAGNAGALYVASDQFYEWAIDDGAVWQPVGGMGVGAISVDPTTLALIVLGASASVGEKVLIGGPGTPPTTSPPDVAQLWIENTQGVDGRAAWVTRPESGDYTPIDPVLFRRVGESSGFIGFTGTTETSLGLWTLTANTLVNRSLEFALRFDLSNTSGSTRTATIRVKLGAVQLATWAAVIPTGTSSQGLYLCNLDALTPTTQRVSQKFPIIIPAPSSVTFSSILGTLNAATDLTLEMTADWSGTGATLNAYALTVRLI